jgi:hypothetical protein
MKSVRREARGLWLLMGKIVSNTPMRVIQYMLYTLAFPYFVFREGPAHPSSNYRS